MSTIKEFPVTSKSGTEFIDITDDVNRLIRDTGTTEGVCLVFVPHTTAAVTINENADSSVTGDMAHALDKAIPWSDPAYMHMEGNTAAHVKSSLFGCSELVVIKGGELFLGTWQGLYFCEFDGPRVRRVIVRISE